MIKRRPKLETLSIQSLKDNFPAYPLKQYFVNNEDETTTEKYVVVCQKDKGNYPCVIPIEVCLKSPVRFDPKDKQCRICFGLRRKQEFPEMFLNSPKIMYLPEMEKVIDGRKNQKIERKGKKKKEEEKDFTPKEEEGD